MQVVIPVAVETPKTRLEPVLSSAEREQFARAMLEDVLAAIDDTGHEPTVLATAPIDLDSSVRVDDRPLSEAVNTVLETATEPVAVVMADLALATSDALEALFSADGDVVIAPGRGGGTNALLVRHPAFRVDYHGASFLDHRTVADEIGARLETVDSYRLATDIDEPADLVEVLLHGRPRSQAFLEEVGFRLQTTGGRVAVARDETPRADGPEPK